MHRPNRTHATPGISANQAKAVQDKAKAMGIGGTTNHAKGSDEAKSQSSDVEEKESSTEPKDGKGETGAKDVRDSTG